MNTPVIVLSTGDNVKVPLSFVSKYGKFLDRVSDNTYALNNSLVEMVLLDMVKTPRNR